MATSRQFADEILFLAKLRERREIQMRNCWALLRFVCDCVNATLLSTSLALALIDFDNLLTRPQGELRTLQTFAF
jgi:hypothetical protein